MSNEPELIITDEEKEKAREHEQSLVGDFLENYFAEIRDITLNEEHFIKSLNIPIETRIDYIRLLRFLRTAIKTLQEIDLDFMKGTLNKLFRDTHNLSEYYQTFGSESKRTSVIFENHFLANLKPYKELQNAVETQKSHRDTYDLAVRTLQEQVNVLSAKVTTNPTLSQELKTTKDKLANTIHQFACARDECQLLVTQLTSTYNLYKEMFVPSFDTARTKYMHRFTRVLNKKLAILDKLMWVQASQSKMITAYFSSSQIVGEFSTKTYIHYYIRNLDPSKTTDEWHTYLRRVLNELP